MKTAIDTNVFSRLWLGGTEIEQTRRALSRCSADGQLVICPVVQAEMLANPTVSEDDVVSFLRQTRVRVDYALSQDVWMDAGRRYRTYTRRKRISGGGDSRRLVADFVVGAHALHHASRLLTYDRRLFQTYFPDLQLFNLTAG